LLKKNGSNCKPAIQLRPPMKAPSVPFREARLFPLTIDFTGEKAKVKVSQFQTRIPEIGLAAPAACPTYF
jgi:hypothetical protein